MKHSERLVVFDVEGVLLPKRRFLLFEVAGRRGFLTFLRFFVIGVLYEIGLLSLESTLKRLFWILKGMPIDELFDRYRRLPLMPGAGELFEKLRELGFRTALISSGMPRILVEDLSQRLRADYSCGLDVSLHNGRLTGEISGDVIKRQGKAAALKEVLSRSEFSPCNCVVVADDRNNLPLLEFCGLSVGFNPDFILSFKSDFVVKENLLGILPVLAEENVPNRHALSRTMTLRRLIHISGILVPLVCRYLLNDYVAVALILVVVSLYTVSELLRMFGKEFPVFSTVTLKSADESELQEFAVTPIFYALGIVFSLLLFPQPASYASIAVLTLGDGFAAIFGRKLGKTVFPLNKGKKVEGSLFGWFFAFLGSLLFVDPFRAMIGATVGLLTECLPSPIDDNLAIPVASGLALTLTI